MKRLSLNELRTIERSCLQIEKNLNKTIEIYNIQKFFSKCEDNQKYLDERINVCDAIIESNKKVLNSLNYKMQKLKTEDSSCQHRIVKDYIDINPDKGMNISYCDICFKTF